MIFQHTIDKVLDGSKCQTARLVKPGQWLWENEFVMTPAPDGVMVDENGQVLSRVVYQVGKTYAAQPGRGKPAVARIRIESIARQDVREISAPSARREGFDTWMEFLDVWIAMHDKQMVNKWEHWIKRLEDRPAERYDAWVIRFCLVEAE